MGFAGSGFCFCAAMLMDNNATVTAVFISLILTRVGHRTEHILRLESEEVVRQLPASLLELDRFGP